jgi:large subunit ribosomal protein L9
MEVILLERIDKLGQMGDLVVVKPGFARNFLLPQQKAVTATEEHKAQFESQRIQLEAQNLEQKTEAEKIGQKLEGQKIVMVRQAGEAGQLYGSVSASNISDGITEAGFSINRNQVKLGDPIKSIGMHPVAVTLHPEVSVSITINVARSIEEAKIQEKTGAMVISDEVETNSIDELIEELDSVEANMPSETEADDQARTAKTVTESDTPSIDDISDGASKGSPKPGTKESE